MENLHADGACLDNATMKKLNKDINDRFYTVLSIWFNGTDEEEMSLERTLNFLAKFYGQNWENAKEIDILML